MARGRGCHPRAVASRAVAGLVAKRRELAVANSRWRGSPSYKFEKPGVTGEHHLEEPAVTGYRKTRGGGEHLRRNCYRGAAMLRAFIAFLYFSDELSELERNEISQLMIKKMSADAVDGIAAAIVEMLENILLL